MSLTTWEVWAGGVLGGIGAPINSVNVDTLWAWSGAESLPRDRMSWCNPLNTTQQWPGGINMNSVGVKAYLTALDGIGATVTTLTNGHYPVILSNLRGSLSRKFWANACPNLGTWGTGCGWLHSNYGQPPDNLIGGLDVATADDIMHLLTAVNGVTLARMEGEIKALQAAVAALPTGGLPPADISALTLKVEGIAATLSKIENALRAA